MARGGSKGKVKAAKDAEEIESGSLNVGKGPLKYSNATDALRAQTEVRYPFKIENDDYETERLEENAKEWVRSLRNVMSEDYNDLSDDSDEPEEVIGLSADLKQNFLRWQKQAHSVCVNFLEKKDDDYVEACCWNLFEAVIKVHILGTVKLGRHKTRDRKTKCSERLVLLLRFLGQYAPIRRDVLQMTRIDELASSPKGTIKHMLQNCSNNFRKSKQLVKKPAQGERPTQDEQHDVVDGGQAESLGNVDQPVAKTTIASAEKTKKRARSPTAADFNSSKPTEISRVKRSRVKGALAEKDADDTSDIDPGSESDDEQGDGRNEDAGVFSGQIAPVVQGHGPPKSFQGFSWGAITVGGPVALSQPIFGRSGSGVTARSPVGTTNDNEASPSDEDEDDFENNEDDGEDDDDGGEGGEGDGKDNEWDQWLNSCAYENERFCTHESPS